MSRISGGGAVEFGQKVSLTVSPPLSIGTIFPPSDMTFEWQKNGTVIAGATNQTFVIESAAPSDDGTYTVVERSAAGELASSVDVHVLPKAAPVFIDQRHGFSVYVGQSVTIDFSATGSYPRTYQWRKNGVNIPGATAATRTINPVTTSDAGSYVVVVTNAYGSATSNSISLTVNAAIPPILSSDYPYDRTVEQGCSGILKVVNISGSSPFTYQWFKDGVAVPGATTTQLTIDAAALSDAGKYSATVTNIAGSARSREAIVTVTPATPVSISYQPQSVTVFVGQSAEFKVSASGSSPYTFQWLKNGSPIANATDSVYCIPAVAIIDAGSYSVVVSNILGAVSSRSAILTVSPAVAPTITSHPKNVSVTEGNSFSLSVAASGSPPFKYQWFLNGVPVTAASTSSSYSATAKASLAGKYSVVVGNAAGSVTSANAIVAVLSIPLPSVSRLRNVTVAAGSSFELTADYYYSSSGSVSYEWYKDGKLLIGANQWNYTVANCSVANAGDYFVVITNSSGSTASLTARVVITAASESITGAGWLKAERFGDIVNFAFSNPARVERCDLSQGTWLSTIILPRSPTALTVNAAGLFVAYGPQIYRYALDGTGETLVASGFTADIADLSCWNDILLAAARTSQLASIRLSDGVKVSTRTYGYYWSAPMAVAPSRALLLSHTIGLSPSDLTKVSIQPDGTLGTSALDSSYHDNYPIGSRLFVFPDDSRAVDDSGIVYTLPDLTFSASLGGKFDDLTFLPGSQLLVLRGSTLHLYDSSLRELGEASLPQASHRVFERAGVIHAFTSPSIGGSITHSQMDLSAIRSPAPAAPVDANTTEFKPDAAFMDKDGVLYLYSKLQQQLFRWLPAQRRYLDPIPLTGWPNFVTYSATTHRVYLGYSDNRITQIRLDVGSTIEEYFATAPTQIFGLATAGEYVILCDPSGGGVSLYSYAPTGKLVAQRASSYRGNEFVWNPQLRRLYQFRDDTSPNDLLYTEITPQGTFGKSADSPYHGEVMARYPIRISQDGSNVLLGSGVFYLATTLAENSALPNQIDDAAWLNQRLYTGLSAPAGFELQRWSTNSFVADRNTVQAGRLVRLFTTPGGNLLAVAIRNGLTTLLQFDADLNLISSDVGGINQRLANISARAQVGKGDQILIPGFVVSGAQPKRVLVRAAGPSLSQWGITGLLADPQIAIHNSAGVVIASNDNWNNNANLSELVNAVTRTGSFPFANNSKDAALLVTLEPGAYSIQARGVGDTTGVALVEVYDAEENGANSRLSNLSARALVGTGSDILIPGFVVDGSGTKTLLVRAVGPALSTWGVQGVLANPRIRLYRGEQLLQENDDWGTHPSASAAAAAAARIGAFALPAGGKDAAFLITLPAGVYTTQISGSDGGGGVALVEIYEIEP